MMVVRDPADKDKALAVRRKVFIEEQEVPEDLELDEWDEDPRTVHIVVIESGSPVGAARMIPYGEKTMKIGRMAVLPSHRRRGLGSRVIGILEEIAEREGQRTIVLDAQVHARGFYERLGYEAEGEEFMDAGIPHIRMRKELRAQR
ncbi:GNAT family N-acetyltransferase [Kyrpidia sp.]|uniref:GNAT family N-acetyltransferase n=1 Tax=Kyrpidia sp. TaxID=2073077 RepID=UPI00259050CC|nr:GNAT family N-acetyltransferase [Kyrpidia sp.]